LVVNRLAHQRYQQILADQERNKDPLKELGKLKQCHPNSIAATLAEAFSQSGIFKEPTLF
jgi:hypothetical protein